MSTEVSSNKVKALAPLLRYWNIVTFKVYANVKGEIEKTYLGCLWWIIEPLLNTAVFYIIFNIILGVRTENFIVFLYTGMVAYGFYSMGIAMGADSIAQNSGILKQIYMPKYMAVIISVFNVAWKFLFSLTALFVLLWFSSCTISWSYLCIPFILAGQIISVICISMPLAAIIPYFPDGKTVLATVLQYGLWFSCVFYDLDRVPEHLHWLFYFNPAAMVIIAYRTVLINGEWPDPMLFVSIIGMSLVFGSIGWVMLKRIDLNVLKRNF